MDMEIVMYLKTGQGVLTADRQTTIEVTKKVLPRHNSVIC